MPAASLQQAFDRLIAKEKKTTLGTSLLIVLILILVGALPNWPHSRSWGYAPSGVIGLVLVVLLILVLLGQL
jgi:multisubunit Na+/H+ antiporter MnhG subunit